MAKITDNSHELSFHGLTSTSSVLLVPLFQREYVWTNRQLERMIAEIEAIESGKDTTRFLGAVIAVTRPTNPSQPSPHEIVDGQQRLTTLYMFLAAAAHVAAKHGQDGYAKGLISTNLIVDWAQEIPVNTKLQPSIADRSQFKAIFDNLSNSGSLSDWLPVRAKLPSPSGPTQGALLRQYDRIRKYLQKRAIDDGFDAIEALVEIVRNSMTFVFILLKDPGSATTVFEGLNDPGIPISVGDLVKNEVFYKIGYDEPKARSLHDTKWIPFRDKFGETFNEYFFPFSVIHRSNTSRTEMFGELRKLWAGKDASAIITDLDEYSAPFLALHGLTDPIDLYGKDVGSVIKRLAYMRCPSSAYPFLMRVLREYAKSIATKKDTLGVLLTVESFIARRAICGIEPTGLLGLFRTMWSKVNGHPTGHNVAQTILERLTVEWPDNERLSEAIRNRPLYGSSIARYAILEYDRSLGSDHPGDVATIEHVMPQSYCDEWASVVTKEDHGKLRHLWANLVPVSKEMNGSVDQLPYSEKRPAFLHESMFISTRRLAKDNECWGPDQIAKRSDILTKWATDRWPRPSKN